MFESTPNGMGETSKFDLFLFSDASGTFIGCCSCVRLIFSLDDVLHIYAFLAIAKVRTKSGGVILPTAELLSVLDATKLAHT